MEKPWYERLGKWVSAHSYNILYGVLLIALSRYILTHWDECISMQFFSCFDGNNILFLVWIILIVLPFYSIEGKGFKLKIRGIERATEKIQDADLQYEIEKSALLSDSISGKEGGNEI
jgi:hypothetical protein